MVLSGRGPNLVFVLSVPPAVMNNVEKGSDPNSIKIYSCLSIDFLIGCEPGSCSWANLLHPIRIGNS